MLIIPAIDLRQGKCVRLRHGRIEEETIYSDNPVEMAQKWVSQGGKRLHVIDLDGAFTGEPKNLDWVIKIRQETGVPVQMGGGLRTLHVIDRVLAAGIDRVILGTVLVENAGLAKQIFAKHGEKVMVALDVKNGFVAVRGWTDASAYPLEKALKLVEDLGGKEVIYTDVSRDGTLEGVNIESMKKAMSQTKLTLIASGGVSNIEDIRKLKKINCAACITGKAIYEGRLDVAEAIDLATSET